MRLPQYIRRRLRMRAARLRAQAQSVVHHVDQQDLQGNVLCGYGDAFARGLFLFVNFQDLNDERRVAARRWIRDLAEQVTDAVPWAAGHKPSWTLNVALSYAGLEALGVPAPVLASFPEDFSHGMKVRAEPKLGETGECRPDAWQEDLRTEAHVLLTVTARTRAELSRREQDLATWSDPEQDLLKCVHRQDAGLLDHPAKDIDYAREHFGFADGFSQPAIAGNAGPTERDGMGTPWKRGGWRDIAPGEFVLGYRGEDGVLPQAPVAPLGLSGSYMVVRKIQQHVGKFREFLEKYARVAVNGNGSEKLSPQELAERKLAAQVVGRWQDGRSLVKSQKPFSAEDHRERGFPESINRFRYSADPDGYSCPLGSHVRRANPRDDINPRPANASPEQLAKRFKWHGKLAQRHRIIRRGLPYPDLNKEEQERQPADSRERGLMFVCYQASIERQFELIQGKWLNDGDAFWLGAERDFLTIPQAPEDEIPNPADQPYGYNRMTLQDRKEPRFLSPHPWFVTVRGGGYYFTPGLSALRALGSAYWL